ncbi:MAG: hypothetical protein HOV81_04110 [Kofleriaceae bacterium]|nr:hypothetical protein [Kofleriaceae bacterium]
MTESLEKAPFSGKGIAPFLDRENPERAAACMRAADLIANMGGSDRVFNASPHLIEPLLALLPFEPAAAHPLAALGEKLTYAHAYPEAQVCIDAVIDLESTEPFSQIDEPWGRDQPMTWPWQQALLWLWRGEGRLAAGDRAGGEAALAEGARRAEASAMPEVFGLLGPGSPFKGTVADRRLWALVRGASALRLRFEGKDACAARKVKKPKKGAKPDPALLALARAYVDDALAVIGPRVAAQYAGLEPKAEKHALELERHAWQRFAYFESGLLSEHVGDMATARLHLGRAKWISALFNPGHRHDLRLLEVIERLGIENVPLA